MIVKQVLHSAKVLKQMCLDRHMYDGYKVAEKVVDYLALGSSLTPGQMADLLSAWAHFCMAEEHRRSAIKKLTLIVNELHCKTNMCPHEAKQKAFEKWHAENL